MMARALVSAAIVAAVMLGFVLPSLLDSYAFRLVIFSMIYSLLAIGLNINLGFRGELSLGHQTFFGVGAYVSAIAATAWTLPLIVLIPLAGVFAGIAGFAVGLIALRMRGPYFVIVTLSVGVIAQIIATNWVELTNGPMGISGVGTAPESWLGFATPIHTEVICYQILLFLIVATSWVTHALKRSHYGRAWRALQDHEDLAAAIGIRPFALDMPALMISASICGLAGAVYAFYTSIVAPDDVFSFNIVITMLVAVVLGGRGTVAGPILGAFIFTFVPEYLRVAQEWRLPIFGLALLLLVLLAPEGIVAWLGRIKRLLSAKRNATTGAV